MGPKKGNAGPSKGSSPPNTDKTRKYDHVILYLPNKKNREDAGLDMFTLMSWATLTKHPSFPTPPARLLRGRKVEDDDRLREYKIPYYVGTVRVDLIAHIYAVVEKGDCKKGIKM